MEKNQKNPLYEEGVKMANHSLKEFNLKLLRSLKELRRSKTKKNKTMDLKKKLKCLV